jgi:hypothetical protein
MHNKPIQPTHKPAVPRASSLWVCGRLMGNVSPKITNLGIAL